MSIRTYVVIEPGADAFGLPPSGATRTFSEAATDGGMPAILAQVERAVAADRARGGRPAGLVLLANDDTSPPALELRSRLLGVLAEAMLPWGGEISISASPGRPLLMARALSEWVLSALRGSNVGVSVHGSQVSTPRAA